MSYVSPHPSKHFSQQHNAWGAPVGLVGQVTSREGGREEPHAPYIQFENQTSNKLNWLILNFRFAPAISPSGSFGVSLGFCLTHWGGNRTLPRIINLLTNSFPTGRSLPLQCLNSPRHEKNRRLNETFYGGGCGFRSAVSLI